VKKLHAKASFIDHSFETTYKGIIYLYHNLIGQNFKLVQGGEKLSTIEIGPPHLSLQLVCTETLKKI
jgi:hypothetical protein